MIGGRITWRSIAVGLIVAAGLAWLTPVNDWLLRSTPLYNNQNPAVITALAVLLGLVVNPLLGRHRFKPAEIVVILAMALAVGGVISGGLLRRHTAIMAGAAHQAATVPGLAPLAQRDGDQARWPFPGDLFLGFDDQGHLECGTPAFENSVNRYFIGGGRDRPLIEHGARVRWRDGTGEHEATAWFPTGLGPAPERIIDLAAEPDWRGLRPGDRRGQAEILAVSEPDLPWSWWWTRLAAWAPLIVGGLACLLGLAGIVRKQWMDHERLAYPITQVHAALIGIESEGTAPLLKQRAFWWAFGFGIFILGWKGLADLGFFPIGVTTRIEVWKQFLGPPWDQVYSWWFCFNLNIWFSVIALTFLMPKDLSFSLWACWWGLNLGYLILRQIGIPIENHHASDASVGGYVAFAVLICWTGRSWYRAALVAAFRHNDDPDVREAGLHVRLLLAGMIACYAFLVWFGAPPLGSLVAILAFLLVFLILGRIVAEAGLPFFSFPGNFNRIIFACCGVSAPPAALIMLGSLGFTLLADSREGLLPYATHAQALGRRSGLGTWGLTRCMFVALVIALVIGAATMILIADRNAGHPDTFWKPGFVNQLITPLADGIAAGETRLASDGSPLISGTIGALIVAAVGWLRLHLAAFPLHPIGLLVCTTYATSVLAFSYFLGWAVKTAVLRYGGVGLYRRLIPCAIGLIAAEAIMSLAVVVVIAAAKAWGIPIGTEPLYMPR